MTTQITASITQLWEIIMQLFLYTGAFWKVSQPMLPGLCFSVQIAYWKIKAKKAGLSAPPIILNPIFLS